MAAQQELGLDALLHASKAELVEPSRFEREDAAVVDVGERRATPQGEPGGETIRSESGAAASKCFATLGEKSFEAGYVEPVCLDLEDVPRRARDEPDPRRARRAGARRTRGAFVRRREEASHATARRSADRSKPGARFEEEQCEEGALSTTAQSQRLTVPYDFYRAEHPEVGGRESRIRHGACTYSRNSSPSARYPLHRVVAEWESRQPAVLAREAARCPAPGVAGPVRAEDRASARGPGPARAPGPGRRASAGAAACVSSCPGDAPRCTHRNAH